MLVLSVEDRTIYDRYAARFSEEERDRLIELRPDIVESMIKKGRMAAQVQLACENVNLGGRPEDYDRPNRPYSVVHDQGIPGGWGEFLPQGKLYHTDIEDYYRVFEKSVMELIALSKLADKAVFMGRSNWEIKKMAPLPIAWFMRAWHTEDMKAIDDRSLDQGKPLGINDYQSVFALKFKKLHPELKGFFNPKEIK